MAFSLRISVSEPFANVIARAGRAAGVAVRGGVAAATEGAKQEMRRALRAAGLGDLGNAITSDVYPDGPSLRAAGVIRSRGGEKWDRILDSWSTGVTIRREDGVGWLAIPTENVPKLGQGVEISPKAVEAYFGRPLEYVPPYVVKSARGVALLVMPGLARAKSARSAKSKGAYRPGTARRLADGRGIDKPVVMFVLVPQVSLRKAFDPVAIFRAWADRAPEFAGAIVAEE